MFQINFAYRSKFVSSAHFVIAAAAVAIAMSFVGRAALAVPVMNENAALSGLVTIFPDHANPNLFYVAPNVMSVCFDETGSPRYSYQDLQVNGSMHAIVQMTLCAQYDQKSLDEAKAQMLKANPNAKFTALPFISSAVVFDPVLSPYMVKEFCGHTAGMVGDEQTCSFHLNHQGRAVFIKQVNRQVALTMQYQYSVAGFLKKPDGTYSPQNSEYGVAVRIGGEELRGHH